MSSSFVTACSAAYLYTRAAVDSRSSQTFSGRVVTRSFDVTNATAYKYYRLLVTANNGSTETPFGGTGLVQLSEFVLSGTPG